MFDPYLLDPISRYAAYFQLKQSGSCLYTSYNGFINYFRGNSWDSGAGNGGLF